MKKPICPLMKNYQAKNETVRLCQDPHWEIRKLYPYDFSCCENGKCFLCKGGKGRQKEMECSQREKCRFGKTCPGPETECEIAAYLQEKERELLYATHYGKAITIFF